MESNEWVKLVLKSLVQDLARARARLALLRDEKIGGDAALALGRMDMPKIAEYEAAAREALTAVEEDS